MGVQIVRFHSRPCSYAGREPMYRYFVISSCFLDTRLLTDTCCVEGNSRPRRSKCCSDMCVTSCIPLLYTENTARVCVPRGSTAVIAAPTGSPRAGPGFHHVSTCQEKFSKSTCASSSGDTNDLQNSEMSYSSSKREAREPADLDLCFSLSSDSRTTGSGPKEARYLAICENALACSQGGSSRPGR